MSASTLSRRLILPLLILGLAAMFVGSISYRLGDPVLIKHVAVRGAGQFEEAPFHGPEAGGFSPGSPEFMARISDLMTILKEEPDSFETRMELAHLFMEAHDAESAATHLQRALDLRPDSQVAHHNMGILLYELDRFEESALSFEQALALEEAPGTMFGLGLIYLRHLGKETEGLELLERAAAMGDPELRERSRAVLEDSGKSLPQ